MSETTHTLPIKIYYEDTDAGGLVHHSNYLRYFERARESILGQQRLVDLFQDRGESFVVTSVEVTYKKGSSHGKELEVRTIPRVSSEYRIVFQQDIHRADDGTQCVQGLVTMVCVQGLAMRLGKLPPFVLSSFPVKKVVTKKKGKLSHLPKVRGALADAAATGGHAGTRRGSTILTCYLEDTDWTGVCYYANYLKWMERARAEMIGIKTLAKMRDGGKGIGAAIHKVRLTYKEGARFGDRVHISTVGSKLSDFRLAFSHEVRRVPPMDEGEGLGSPELMRDLGSRGTLLVSGEVEMVFLDKGGAGALVKVPDTLSL